ncbi:hypothetical protein T484DRAFT_2344890 [Baffinella frigidus]|nr:hypothetical protein T484DRAFT_2344890 [Cryptophyta sp. CCMP2293]
MSYNAFLEKTPDATPADKRLFFLSYAQVWCGTKRPETEKDHVRYGVHSPKRYRVLGTLRDSPEFAAAYECPNKAPMNPDKKCVVW